MASDWEALTRLTRGEPFLVERIRLREAEIAIEGAFEPPPLAGLPAEDQVFVVAFLQSHGSIKAMERAFGVSYPTIKARLNRISARLPMVEVESGRGSAPRGRERVDVIDDLEAGHIDVAEALRRLDR